MNTAYGELRSWKIGSLYQDEFNKATDEQIAQWVEDAQKAEAHNKDIFRKIVADYQKAIRLVERLYGVGSNEVRYIKRKDPLQQYRHYIRLVEGIDRHKEKRKAHLAEKEALQRQEEDRAKEIQARESEIRDIERTAAQYGLDASHYHTIWDMVWDLLKQDKYLFLGFCGRLNRMSWLDGYSWVKRGLDFFVEYPFEGDWDRGLYETWYEIAYMYDDVDGRYFRDLDGFDYDTVIDQTVDKGLLGDVRRLWEKYGLDHEAS